MFWGKLDFEKKRLDEALPFSYTLVGNLDEWFRIELTYSSNAIEGNTLTRRETALVVEKGLTVGGKSLVEHLEAVNHSSALDWVKMQVNRKPAQLKLGDILLIHELILKGIDDGNAGHFRTVPVRISGSRVVLPNPRKVPDLMDDFIHWIKKSKLHSVELAADVHYKLVTIHPFADGNGRTARLLMNLILMMYGYPPAIIRPRDRLAYISALEEAQLGGKKDKYYKIIFNAVKRSLGIYLKAIEGKADEETEDKLLKIGELAKAVKETNSTVRHWTKFGLLDVAEITASNYQLYSSEMISRIEKIKGMKEKRYTLEEIKEELSKEN